LAGGAVYPGYCRSVRADWDASEAGAQSWTSRHGGHSLSVLLLQTPVIFANGRQFDFQLRIPKLRRAAIEKFYDAIGKKPFDVFPLQFEMNSGLASGITSGTLDGFYRFPIGQQ